MNGTSYFQDPAQQFFLTLSQNKAEQNKAYYERMAMDPALTQSLIAHSTMNPTASAELNLALAQGGVPAGDPLAQFAVNQEMQMRDNRGGVENPGGGWWDELSGVVDEWVTNPLQGAVRWGFSAWDAAYNMLAGGAPIRAREQARQEGIEFSEAWADQDPYFFEALGGVFAGERVNLGSGWLPNSDVADPVRESVNQQMMQIEQDTQSLGANERYRTRLEAAPGVWTRAISDNAEAQAQFGKPLTQMHDAQAESVMFTVNDIYGNQRYTPWSPGRIAAANFTEPGTTSFKIASGIGDFTAQIFADPVEWVGLGWAKAGRNGRLIWAEAQKVADEVASAPFGYLPAGAPSPDPTRAMALGMGPQTTVGRPRIPPETTMQGGIEGATKRPWWASGVESTRRPLSAFDPPKWYVDRVRSMQARSLDEADVMNQKPRRKMAGIYDIDLPRLPGQRAQTARIQRRGKGKKAYWEVVMPDGSRVERAVGDPRFDQTSSQFRTLDEATQAARGHITGNFEESSKVHGMTVDEFTMSAEEFAVDDPLRLVDPDYSSRKPGQARVHRAKHRKSKTARGQLENARIMVFGRTLDLTEAVNVSDVPKGLQDALRADGKVRGDKIVGFGDPKLDRFDNTMRWMEENGYGKAKWNDDVTLIHDNFVGGDPASRELSGRAFFDQGDKPMYQYRAAPADFDNLDAPTPNEVNEIVEFVATSGWRAADEAVPLLDEPQGQFVSAGTAYGPDRNAIDPVRVRSNEMAERVRSAAQQQAPDGTVRGVRNDILPDYTLKGKKADRFLDALVSTTRKAGQRSDTALLDNLLEPFRNQGVDIPNSVRNALFEAQSKDEVAYIFSEWMVKGQVPELLLPGGTRFGRLSTVTGTRIPQVSMSERHWLSRRMAQSISSRDVNVVESPDDFYSLVLDALPNYNLSRGAEIPRFDMKTGEALEGTIKIEDVLTRIRTMMPGDKAGAYEAMGQLNQALFSNLVNEGVDPKLAEHAARWFKQNGEYAVFDAERLGKVTLDGGVDEAMVVDDALLGGLGPQLSADLWDGALTIPDMRSLKRAVNETDALGRIANRLTTKGAVTDEAGDIVNGLTFDERMWFKFANATMNKVWKPFVLLRGAWTIRILMDDQMRMAADGYQKFNHPARIFNYALAMSKDTKTAFGKGWVDINGVRFSTKNLDEMQHAQIYDNALMSKRDAKIGRGAYGYRHTEPVRKGAARYNEGMVFEMKHLNGSVTTKVLAGSPAENAVEDTVAWLSGRGRKGLPDPAPERANLAELYRDTPDTAAKIIQGDENTIRMVVQRQEAILHHRLGGDVVLDNGKGQLLNFDRYALVDEVDPSDSAGWIIRQRADEDLLKIVGSDNPKELTDEGVKELQKLIGKKVEASQFFPSHVRGPRNVQVSGAGESLGDTLNGAVNGLFDFFMTLPSNKLSRSPEFARAYWQRMEQFAPYMDEALWAKVLDEAPISSRKSLEKARKAERGGVEYLTDADTLDLHAKSYALTRVESTLFNIAVDKRNISDSLNLVFPFVEAWGEFLSRWGRLMVTGDKNIANARRFQQAVEGLRGSGVFHENEYGQEVFSYPAFMTTAGVKLHNTLNNIPGLGGVLGGDVSAEVAGNIELTGSAESLNFASSIIPGFGPVFQMASKTFLPDDPKFDWIRDVISPFGQSGGIASQFAPAWVKRMLSANGGFDDPALTYTWNTTRMNVIRTMIDRGDFAGVTDEASLRALLDKADDEAQGIMMVRAAATYYAPASPSMIFQKEDKNGMVWTYSNLGQEFYKMQQELGDEGAAFDAFFERFGFLPQAFRGAKTYSVRDVPLDESGDKFRRANQELFDKYPGTAMYVDPNILDESDYDHEAMLSALARGDRMSYTPEQFMYLQQDQLGDLWLDNANQQAALMEPSRAKQYLIGVKEQIREAYPYWNQQVPGKAQSITNQQQMAEVQRMIQDPSLENEPAIVAARVYENLRQQVLAEIAQAGASTISGPKGDTQAGKIATFGREWLRQKGEELSMIHPEFSELYSNVYAYEVAESHDAVQPEIPVIDAFGEGDLFYSLGVAS